MPASKTGGTRRDCQCPRAQHVHGTRAAYISDGCRCDDCRQANRHQDRASRRRRVYGLTKPRTAVPADKARAHTIMLMTQGHSLQAIAKAANLHTCTISRILYGLHGEPTTRITPATETAILNATPGVKGLTPNNKVPTLGARRRLEALQTLGYSIGDIGQRVGTTGDSLRHCVYRPTKRILKATHDAIAAVYTQLCMTPAPDTQYTRRAITYATRYGYAPPLAWDDIDNPDEKPNLGTKSFKNASLPDEVEFLLDSGVSPDFIHERFGYKTRSYLQGKMQQLGRYDIAERLNSSDYHQEHSSRSRKNAA